MLYPVFEIIVSQACFCDIRPGIEGAIGIVIPFFQLGGGQADSSINDLPGVILIPVAMEDPSLLFHLFEEPGAGIGSEDMKGAGR